MRDKFVYVPKKQSFIVVLTTSRDLKVHQISLQEKKDDHSFAILKGKLKDKFDHFFENYNVEQLDFEVAPLDKFSPFQVKVWQALRFIPAGQVMSYGEFCHFLGLPVGHARAVARVLGQNPLALYYPCHRIVAASGLGGFSFGIEVKKSLLKKERGVFRAPTQLDFFDR